MKKLVLSAATATILAAHIPAKAADAVLMTTIGPFYATTYVAAWAVMTTLLPTATTADAINNMKETFAAAKEDAAMFVATEGQIEKSAALEASMEILNQIPAFDNLSEVELASAVYQLAE